MFWDIARAAETFVYNYGLVAVSGSESPASGGILYSLKQGSVGSIIPNRNPAWPKVKHRQDRVVGPNIGLEGAVAFSQQQSTAQCQSLLGNLLDPTSPTTTITRDTNNMNVGNSPESWSTGWTFFRKPRAHSRVALMFLSAALILFTYSIISFPSLLQPQSCNSESITLDLQELPWTDPNRSQPSTATAPGSAWKNWPDTLHPLSLDATLEQRIEAWQSVPVANAADWHEFNLQTCPPNQNHNRLLHGYVDRMISEKRWLQYWQNPERIQQLREDLFKALLDHEAAQRDHPQSTGDGRGMVFAAGNSVSASVTDCQPP